MSNQTDFDATPVRLHHIFYVDGLMSTIVIYDCHPHAKGNKVSSEMYYFCGNFAIFLVECGMSAWLV